MKKSFLPELAGMKVAVEKFDPRTGKRGYSVVPAERETIRLAFGLLG
ncbi:MAG: hypothetical protein ACREEM_14795 [Blastocatellia bacterium]